MSLSDMINMSRPNVIAHSWSGKPKKHPAFRTPAHQGPRALVFIEGSHDFRHRSPVLCITSPRSLTRVRLANLRVSEGGFPVGLLNVVTVRAADVAWISRVSIYS